MKWATAPTCRTMVAAYNTRAALVDGGFAWFDKHGCVRYWWMGELNWEGAEGKELFRRHIEELLDEL